MDQDDHGHDEQPGPVLGAAVVIDVVVGGTVADLPDQGGRALGSARAGDGLLNRSGCWIIRANWTVDGDLRNVSVNCRGAAHRPRQATGQPQLDGVR